MVRAFKFEERSQFLVGADDETLSIVAMCVCNPDRSPVGIHCGRTAPACKSSDRIRVPSQISRFLLFDFSRLAARGVAIQPRK